ncbi:MAG: hypothetical protein PHT33_09980 [bacterium]|nr:hypothetical protein [bacterium]
MKHKTLPGSVLGKRAESDILCLFLGRISWKGWASWRRWKLDCAMKKSVNDWQGYNKIYI